jgi:hypothetical protein
MQASAAEVAPLAERVSARSRRGRLSPSTLLAPTCKRSRRDSRGGPGQRVVIVIVGTQLSPVGINSGGISPLIVAELERNGQAEKRKDRGPETHLPRGPPVRNSSGGYSPT